jgi:hypothetical protein
MHSLTIRASGANSPAGSNPRRRDDGMPVFSPSVTALLDVAVPIAASVIRTFDLGGGLAAAHQTLVGGSPLLICLATAIDNAPAWLAAGQALERVLLTAVNEGLSASYLNQPIEVPVLRDTLRTTLRLDATPQLLLQSSAARKTAREMSADGARATNMFAKAKIKGAVGYTPTAPFSFRALSASIVSSFST